jgi:nicotinate-nucleotide adenylyltransferase
LRDGVRASRIFSGLPPYADGQAIGLYGGSFNPPHAGHRQVSLFALKRLALAQIWWLVTPGNPLKPAAGLRPLEERLQRSAEVAASPRIVVTGAEATLRTHYTANLIEVLQRRAASARFVWIMGSDNLVQFHRWENWRAIAEAVPIAVINRPGSLAAALSARAAQALAPYRVDEADAPTLAYLQPPAWVFLTGPRNAVSSTALRAGAGNRSF